jgi:hypothetical protein
MGRSQPSKLLEKRWNLFHERQAARCSTFDACCWLSPRIRTEPTHCRTEVNGAAVRPFGGQGGRLKTRWSRNMQRCFHHLQRSMHRRLGSSLVPCLEAWAGCRVTRRNDVSPPRLPFKLRAERPRVSSQAGVVSRMSGSRGRLLCRTLLGSRLAWWLDCTSCSHPSGCSVKASSVHFQTGQWDVWLCMLHYLLSN